MKKLIALTILLILCFTFVGCGEGNSTVIGSSSNPSGMTFQEECDTIIAAVILEFYACEVSDIPEEDKLEVTERTFAEEYGIKNYTGYMYTYWDDIPSLERTKNEDGTIKEDGYIIDGFMIELHEFQDEENYQKCLDYINNEVQVASKIVLESYPCLIGIYTSNDYYGAVMKKVVLDTGLFIQSS